MEVDHHSLADGAQLARPVTTSMRETLAAKPREAELQRVAAAATLKVQSKALRDIQHEKEELRRESLQGRLLQHGMFQHLKTTEALEFISQDVADARAKQDATARRLAELQERLQKARAAMGVSSEPDEGPHDAGVPRGVEADKPAVRSLIDERVLTTARHAETNKRSAVLQQASSLGSDNDSTTNADSAHGAHGASAASNQLALMPTTTSRSTVSVASRADGPPPTHNSHNQRSLIEAAARRQAFMAVMDVKRSQYKYRINVLLEQSAAAGEKYVGLMDRREDLKALLRASDKRYKILAAEYAVIRNYRGEQIDSAIMHGKVVGQRFKAPLLIEMVRNEMAQLWDTLAAAKKALAGVKDELEAAYAEKCRLEAAVAERRTAAEAFDANFGNRGRMMAIVARIALRGLSRAWQGWRDYVAQQRRSKAALRILVLRGEQREVAFAWRTWRRATEKKRAQHDAQLAGERRRAAGGIGETTLSVVHGQRSAAVDDAVSLLSWLRHVDAEIAAGEASTHERLALRDVDIDDVMGFNTA